MPYRIDDGQMNTCAFTIKAPNGRLQIIRLPVVIHSIKSKRLDNIAAVIDIGATYTCISNRIVQLLELEPIGSIISRTVGGKVPVNRYIVTIELSPDLVFSNLIVYGFVGYEDIDILIGMDIITAGDFSITEDRSNTVVSFRVPHGERYIDYAE